MNMNYQYRELTYAEQIYKNGFQSPTMLSTELRLVATYMKTVLGYKPSTLKQELQHFCQTHLAGYQEAVHFPLINKALRQAKQKDAVLIDVKQISVSQCALDYINHCHIHPDYEKESHNCRKILFTLYVQNQIYESLYFAKTPNAVCPDNRILYYKGGSRKYNQLKKSANLPASVRIHEDILYILQKSGLITAMYNGLIRLNYIEAIHELEQTTCSKPAINVINFDNIGWYYDYACKIPRIQLCKHCGQPFYKKANRQLYCSDDCQRAAKNEQNKSYYHLANAI